MARDTEEALNDHKKELLEEELERFSQQFSKRPEYPETTNSWISKW
jgi:hypothetical protein